MSNPTKILRDMFRARVESLAAVDDLDQANADWAAERDAFLASHTVTVPEHPDASTWMLAAIGIPAAWDVLDSLLAATSSRFTLVRQSLRIEHGRYAGVPHLRVTVSRGDLMNPEEFVAEFDAISAVLAGSGSHAFANVEFRLDDAPDLRVVHQVPLGPGATREPVLKAVNDLIVADWRRIHAD